MSKEKPKEVQKSKAEKHAEKTKEEEEKKITNLSENTSEKTLDRILVSKRDKISSAPKDSENESADESSEESEVPLEITFNEFAKPGRRSSSVSLDKIAISQGGRVRIDSGWTDETEDEKKNAKKSDGFEYIPKNPEDSIGKTYQQYENVEPTKLSKPEEIASSWSKSFTKKNAKFVNYENPNQNDNKYEKVFAVKNLDEEEMKKLHDRKNMEFQFKETKMHYYDNK